MINWLRERSQKWHKISMLLAVYDAFAVAVSYFLALWIRFDCVYSAIPESYLTPYLQFVPYYMVLSVAIFWAAKLYKAMWRFASYVELARTGIAGLGRGIDKVVYL